MPDLLKHSIWSAFCKTPPNTPPCPTPSPDGVLALLTCYVWLPCVLAECKLTASYTMKSPHRPDGVLALLMCYVWLLVCAQGVRRRHRTRHHASSHRPIELTTYFACGSVAMWTVFGHVQYALPFQQYLSIAPMGCSLFTNMPSLFGSMGVASSSLAQAPASHSSHARSTQTQQLMCVLQDAIKHATMRHHASSHRPNGVLALLTCYM